MSKEAPQKLALMKNFLQIISAGSFSAAAKSSNTSQPTVSRQLRLLEDHLGVQLLNRTTKGIWLTSAGERYFLHATEIAEELERFEEELRGELSAPQGLLRVAVPGGFGIDHLLRIAAEYLTEYPEVKIEWILDAKPIRFVKGTIDCAISVGLPRDKSLITRKLAEQSKIVVAAPALMSRSQPILQPRDLSGLRWLQGSDRPSPYIQLMNHTGDVAKVNVSPILVAACDRTIRKAALLGIGVTVMTKRDAAQDIEDGNLVHLLPNCLTRPETICLTYPRSPHYPRHLIKFVELVHSRFSCGYLVDSNSRIPVTTEGQFLC